MELLFNGTVPKWKQKAFPRDVMAQLSALLRANPHMALHCLQRRNTPQRIMTYSPIYLEGKRLRHSCMIRLCHSSLCGLIAFKCLQTQTIWSHFVCEFNFLGRKHICFVENTRKHMRCKVITWRQTFHLTKDDGHCILSMAISHSLTGHSHHDLKLFFCLIFCSVWSV